MSLTPPVVRVTDDPSLGLELYETSSAYLAAKNGAPETYQFVDVNGNIECGGTNGYTPLSPAQVQNMIQATISYATSQGFAEDPEIPDGEEHLTALDEIEELGEFASYMAQNAEIRWCRIFGTC